MGRSSLAEAAILAVRNLSFPVRLPSYNQPSFWSVPLTITRARPLPGGGTWVDFLVVPNLDLHRKIIQKYIATPFNEGTVEFRWIRSSGLLNPEQIVLPPTVERHLVRSEAHPFPCHFRELYVPAKDTDQLKIQARNLTADQQLTFAAVFGWYYPQFRSPAELSADEGITDTVRNF